jgi:hypothetical protein
LPTIEVKGGNRHLAADEGLAALAKAGVPFYRRDRSLVRVCRVQGKASDGNIVFLPAVQELPIAAIGRALAHVAQWIGFDRFGNPMLIDPPGDRTDHHHD